MKTKLLILFLAVAVIAGCKRKTIRTIEKDMPNGSWRISLFLENQVTQTSDYEIYSFKFYDNGSTQATNNGFSINGNWSVDKDKRQIKFNLSLPAPLDKLSDNWNVASNSSGLLQLDKIDANGSVKYLTFTRI